MIRRRNIQTFEANTDKQELSREGHQKRKESLKMSNRFNYQLGCRADENTDMNDSLQMGGKGSQVGEDSFTKEGMNRTLLKTSKNNGLKKDYLYEDISNERCEGKISLHRSRNQTMRYEKNNTTLFSQEREDIKNTSFQYLPQSLMPNLVYRTGYFGEVPATMKMEHRSNRKRECLNSEEDLQAKYQQLWENNQREKQRMSRQPLIEDRTSKVEIINIAKISKNSIAKNRHQERSLSLRSEQGKQAAITHREYLRASNTKNEFFNCMQTRKSSPTRCKNSDKNISEEVTLRCSPVKHMQTNSLTYPIPAIPKISARLAPPHPQQIQINLRLIEEFTTRISLKIQQLNNSLLTLRQK